MLNYNTLKYDLLKVIKQNKIILLKEKDTGKKIIAKQSLQSKNEYKNLKLLNTLTNIPKIISYEDEILYIEYIDKSISIEEFLTNNQVPSLDEFYHIAIELLNVLNGVHSCGLIHKDLNTNNILYAQDTKKIFLIDFELSSMIKTKIDFNHDIEDLEGHIHFLSPEQTGRVNRTIDFRSDFYSLGVIFYNLLTRRLPFEADDLIGIIHQHISKIPLSLQTINPNIPNILSSFVLKLLEKEPENRYQSINGIIQDLKLIQSGDNDFDLAQNDLNHKLVLKHTNYGRTELIAQIKDIFVDTINKQNKFVTISGFSGTGKSTVVYELHKILSENFGFYGESKFDQLNSSSPYYGFTNILNEYFLTILKQDKDVVEEFKKKLLEVLGKEAFILTSKIKNLEILLGKQVELEKLSAREDEERFHRVFTTLILFLTTQQTPFIFFIDDLQWADSGTIDLIKLIVSNKKITNILIINAYRDNEVDNNHIYMQMLNDLKSSVSMNEFVLQNLTINDVTQLVEDTVYVKDEELINFIYNLSNGNPFFITQTIHLFNNKNLFSFSNEENKFIYDIDALKQIGLSSDVIELATRNIESLDKKVIEVLKFASALGNQFNLNILSEITEINNLEDLLDIAREKYFIIKIQNYYKFSHDRIQQAFYELIDEINRKNMHKNIANKLYNNKDTIDFFTNIDLEIVTQYNRALDILSDEEKQKAIQLNLKVVKSIKAALAYEEAFKFVASGLSILDLRDKELHWEYQYLKLEMLYNTSQINKTKEVIEILEKIADTDEKIANLAGIVVNLEFILGNHQEAVDYGVRSIKKLGLVIPSYANKLTVMKEFFIFKYNLKGQGYEYILELPEIDNMKMLHITRILYDLIPPSYMLSADLNGTYSLIIANIALKHGNSKYAGFGYGILALLLGGVFKNFTDADKLGSIAIKISERFYLRDCNSRTNFLYGCFILHGTKPFRGYLTYKEKTNKDFILTGNALFRNYNDFFTRGQHLVFNASNLDNIKKENIDILNLYISSNEKALIDFQVFTLAMIARLQGDGIKELQEKYNYDKARYEKEVYAQQNVNIKSMFNIFQALEHFIFNEYDKTFAYCKKTLMIILDQQGLMTDHIFRLLHALSYLEKKDTNFIDTLAFKFNKFLLKRYSKFSPENFNVYYHFVLAKEAEINNNHLKAEKYYQIALDEANVGMSLLHIALVNEHFGRYWYRKNTKITKTYLHESYNYYIQHKAFAKAEQLEKEFSIEVITSEPILKPRTSTIEHNNLNFESIIKATRTLSQEINIDNILQKMSNIIIENIGANRGFIILKEDDKLNIIASIEDERITTLNDVDVSEQEHICKSIINYVIASLEPIVINEATLENKYIDNNYVKRYQPKSILCMPIVHNQKLKGILYCENTLLSAVFSQDSVDLISVILAQLIISLDNAYIYKNMESIVNQKTEELQEEKATFEAVFNGSKDAIAILDMESNFLDVNPAYIEMTGRSKVELLKTSCIATTPPEYIQASKEAMEEVKKVGYIKNFEKDCYIIDNKLIHINMSMSLIHNPQRILISVRDITKLKNAQEELKLLASTDPMTKLYNRRYFVDMSKSILDLAKRNKTDITVAMLDIDKFKNVNDTYGHKVGDDVIIALTSILQEQSRESDIVCRWGGEEFIILFPTTNIDGALVISEKIRKVTEDLVIKLENNRELKFTISIGISKFNNEDDMNIEASINRADEALYEAKESGRNKICIKL